MNENDLRNVVNKDVIVTTDEGTFVGIAVGLDTHGNLELIKSNSAIGGTTKAQIIRFPITEIVSCEVIE